MRKTLASKDSCIHELSGLPNGREGISGERAWNSVQENEPIFFGQERRSRGAEINLEKLPPSSYENLSRIKFIFFY